eukprot:CAMPEP_0197439320 /NCGR_PEP_ID=MMETSP1175-20131217/6090_1 /TAXON_ID=1003142 /ORGANISM="Triceratium dubium, Strain CCMP147" /LENGTH=295 /DNA_ID=CAMNT_0042969215 /DNA_START=156 /DNA_END=1043 /DNA_ORIENTATION=+
MTAPTKSRRPSQVSTKEPQNPSAATEPAEGNEKHATDADRIADTKESLREALNKYHGSTKNAEVIAIIEELSALNPTPQPARSPLMLGDWKDLSAPHFPNRIAPDEGEEGVYKYTLGRISFNLFEPKKLVCTLDSVRNPIERIPNEEGEKGQDDEKMSYPLVISLIVHTAEGDLRAIMRNEGVVTPATDDRASVVFSSGALSPAPEVVADAEKMTLWRKTFENAYARADAERSYLARAGRYIFFSLLGLVAPTDAKDSFRFEMKRAPRGYLDVLFLDEHMRITKGNSGSYCVLVR